MGTGGEKGRGGGVVVLHVAGTATIDGTISAKAPVASGSGAGGSINIRVGTLAGTGLITANGGDYNTAEVIKNAGLGGGGRIAIVQTNGNAWTPEIQAFGGYGATGNGVRGAAGTVYLADTGSGYGRLIVNNSNYAAAARTVISSSVTDRVVGDLLLHSVSRFRIDANQDIVLHGSWSNSATAFTAVSGSTVTFSGTNTATLYGTTAFANLICTNAGKTLRFTAGSTQTISSGFTFKGAEGNLLILESTTENSPWSLSQSVVHDVQYVRVRDSDADGNAPVLALNSSNVANNVNWVFTELGDIAWTGNAGNSNWTATNNWNLGRAPLPDDTSITIPTSASGNPQPVLDITRELNGRLTIESGAMLTLNGRNLTINGAVTNAGTLIATGTETLTCRSDVDFSNGTFNRAQSTLALDGRLAQVFKPAGNEFYDIDIQNTNSVTVTDSFAVHELKFTGNDALLSFNGAVTATNITCDIAGHARLTFDAIVDVADTFSVTSPTATNTFSGGVIANTFQSLNAGGGLLTFGAGTDYDFLSFNLRGGVLTNLLLRSSSPGSAWNLNVDGYTSVRFVDARDSDASGGKTVFAINSAGAAANNTNWDFNSGKAWVGTTIAWETSGNWSPPGAPGATHYVLIDGSGTAQPTLNLSGGSTGVLNLVVGATASSTLTLSDGSTNARLMVAGNMGVGSFGILTHTANTTYPSPGEVHRLFMDVDGDLIVDGSINVDTKGYNTSQQGPGGGAYWDGGSHGGQGGNAAGTVGPTYGSITNPTSVGTSGAQQRSAGVIVLSITGECAVNGSVSASSPKGYGTGSGGSINIRTGTLSGSGTIYANGGDFTTGSSTPAAGGGGRIAIVQTNGNVWTPEIQAFGGYQGSGGRSGAAGTVYLRGMNDAYGRLIVDHNRSVAESTLIGSLVEDATVGDVMIVDHGKLRLASDQTLTVLGSWSNAATFTADAGSTVVFSGADAVHVLGDNTFANLTIATSGKAVSFEAGKTQTVNGTPTFGSGAMLLSTQPGVQWLLTVPGSGEQFVGKVSARDSDASGGKEMHASGSGDLGNNLNWVWPPSGSVIMLR